MSTHNTHYATDKVRSISGHLFYVIDYYSVGGSPSWLVDKDVFSFHHESAKRFSSFEDAKSFVSHDFNSGLCDIVSFVFSYTLGKYFSRHRYNCLGGVSDFCDGCLEI